jgi:NAD(P)-dependent dehydrogenase (short-subunit alcohol dehydrogenase family)
MFDFSNQVAVVTGAAGALGQATVQAFVDAGARVAAVDHAADRLADLWDGNDQVLQVTTDLTSPDSVTAMAATITETLGPVDILANIAGGFTMGPPLHKTAMKDWDFMFDLNARSVFLTCHALIPGMRERSGGKVVNVAARAALQGKAKMAPYIASKAAVLRLTESLAAENREQGINVNCILPGTVDTPANRKDMPDADYDKWVPTADLAAVILFLASPAARGVHGAAVPVYGLS